MHSLGPCDACEFNRHVCDDCATLIQGDSAHRVIAWVVISAAVVAASVAYLVRCW